MVKLAFITTSKTVLGRRDEHLRLTPTTVPSNRSSVAISRNSPPLAKRRGPKTTRAARHTAPAEGVPSPATPVRWSI